MPPKTEYRALVIGAGRIGAFYDAPGSDHVLTHAHGFSKVDGFSLAGFLDQDLEKARKAAKIWGGKAYEALPDAVHDGIDVVSLGVPDDAHYAWMKELSGYPFDAVFAEKPLCLYLEEGRELLSFFQSSHTRVLVNYSRRFLPVFQELRHRCQTRQFGRFLMGNGYYVNGFVHNGSHMVDLLHFLLGKSLSFESLSGEKEGAAAKEKGHSGKLRFPDGGWFWMHELDHRVFWVFEMDLFFERKRLRIVDSGFWVEEYDVLPNPVFPESRDFTKTGMIPTKLEHAMWFAVQHLRDCLVGGHPLLCSMEDAVDVLEICHETR